MTVGRPARDGVDGVGGIVAPAAGIPPAAGAGSGLA